MGLVCLQLLPYKFNILEKVLSSFLPGEEYFRAYFYFRWNFVPKRQSRRWYRIFNWWKIMRFFYKKFESNFFHQNSFLVSIVVFLFYSVKRFHVAVHLFPQRSQITSKCGKNKKVPHFGNTFCRFLWSLTVQTHGNTKSVCVT